jgi:hypothetical protein
MTRKIAFRFLTWPALLIAVLALAALACGPLGDSGYSEDFGSLGSWGSGADGDVEGNVSDGVFRLHVFAENGLFWSTGGESFGDGTYQVDATHVAGPVDNGYGLMYRVQEDTDSFYLFEVSSDGFVWIGKCTDGCESEVTPLVDEGWFPHAAVKQGVNQLNQLRVEAIGPNMTFFVNGQQVGQASDSQFTEGDIGVLVETLGEGGVTVNFDNFTVTPPAE